MLPLTPERKAQLDDYARRLWLPTSIGSGRTIRRRWRGFDRDMRISRQDACSPI
jgi:hypothetical protein